MQVLPTARPNTDYAYGIRANGDRCWPMEATSSSPGGGRRVDHPRCEECCTALGRRLVCPNCGAEKS